MVRKLYALALIAATSFTGQAYADEYGCKVLMCLSNPKGPMSEVQCQPPIQKFIDGQAKDPKDPFPSCPEAGTTTMKPTIRPYDPCPDGTSTLGQDQLAVQLAQDVFSQLKAQARSGSYLPSANDRPIDIPQGMTFQTGIGESTQVSSSNPNKVCVAKQLGTLSFNTGTSDSPQTTTVTVYEQISTMAPAASPRVVDVTIDSKLYRSVRY